MPMSFQVKRWTLLLTMAAMPAAAADLPVAKPEQVGLSTERLQRIRQMLERRIEEQHIAGAVMLVARHGKVAYLESVGQMDVEQKKPMQKDTLFRLASMTKPITSVAVMMLYEEGLFNLDDPISKYIPEFSGPRVGIGKEGNAILTEPAKREISIRHLLTHTAGLVTRSNGWAKEEFGKLEDEMRPNGLIEDYTKRLAKLPLNVNPGTTWEYGPSTDVLGYFIELMSGMKFDEFLRKRIFTPLDMQDTFFNVPAEKLARLAKIYGRDETTKKLQPVVSRNQERTNVKFLSGAGGLVSTATDYFRFAQMTLSGGKFNGAQLLSRKSTELMATDHVGPLTNGQSRTSFGLGYRVRQSTGGVGSIGSAGTYGWNGAFETHYWVDPKEELIGILMVQMRADSGGWLRNQFQTMTTAAIVE